MKNKNYKKITIITILIILLVGILGIFSFDVYRKNVVLNLPFIKEEPTTLKSENISYIEKSEDINFLYENNVSELINNTTTNVHTTLPSTTEYVFETTTKPLPSLPSDVISDDEKALINAVNKYRKENNLLELKIDKSLSDIAAIRAKELQTTWSFSRPDGKSYASIFKEYDIYSNYNTYENVARYKEFNTGAILNAWKNSENHKNAMLKKEFDCVGVGVVYDDNGKCYTSVIFINKE